MFKRIKKLSAVILTGTIVLGTIGMTSPVLANNHTDTSFSFTYANSMRYTSARTKQDTSSVYMKCNSISVSNASYTAHAIGTNTTSVIGEDCSQGHTYNFTAGTISYMRNWVYEYGFTYARIGASPNYSYNFTATGVWSPDNYQGY